MTATSLVSSPLRLRVRRGPGAVWLLDAALAGIAIVLATVLHDVQAPSDAVHLPWWALAAGFAAAELCVVHVHVRRSAHSLTLAELPLVLGLVFASPLDVAAAWAVGAGVVLAAQRTTPVRLAFNLTQFAVTALTSAATVHLIAGEAISHGDLRVWFAAGAGVVVGSALAPPLIAIAMGLSGEHVPFRRMPRMIQMAVVVASVNGSLGLAAATVLANDPWSSLLLLAPAAAVFVAYRAYQSERQQHIGAEFLYSAARTLNRAGDPASGLAGLLATANETFRAEIAQVGTFFGGPCVTVGPDERVEIGDGFDEAVSTQLQELLAGDPSARLVRPEQLGGAVAAHLRAAGIDQAMLAGLPGDDGVIGAIVVANRLGVGSFERVDLRLLGTLAGHTGSVLGQDRLGRRVARLQETQRELERQAFHDALTGLANRLLFHDRVRHALARREGNAAVLYIDLDDFKPVNDTLGHDAGDTLLCAVADRLRDTLRAADTAARLGGDEFAVLLVDIDPAHVEIVADRVFAAFAKPVALPGGAERTISASMGIAVAEAGAIGGDELVRNADAAMYACKHGGKRGYSIYAPPAR